MEEGPVTIRFAFGCYAYELADLDDVIAILAGTPLIWLDMLAIAGRTKMAVAHRAASVGLRT